MLRVHGLRVVLALLVASPQAELANLGTCGAPGVLARLAEGEDWLPLGPVHLQECAPTSVSITCQSEIHISAMFFHAE